MDEPRIYNLDDEREAGMVAWRLTCFEELGLRHLAIRLAMRRDVDRAYVERLVKGGCPFELLEGFVLDPEHDHEA